MAWTPVSREKHFDKAVVPIEDFLFCRNQLLVPILIPELRYASNTIPLAFSQKQGAWEFYGVVGLEKNQNVFVDSNGNWLVKFVPATLQTYPFAVSTVMSGQTTLLVSEDSDLVVDRSEGTPFFNEDGTDGAAIKKYTVLLSSILRAKEAINKACSLIEDFGLLQPFEYDRSHLMAISAGFGKNENSIKIEGLYSIREAAFRELEENKYLQLREVYALDLIYAHLYSQGRFEFLLHNMDIRQKSQSTLKHLGADIFGETELDLDFKFSEVND
jgi:hypothetical protein